MNTARRRAETLIPLDPYLGRRQLWGKQSERILEALPSGPAGVEMAEFIDSIGQKSDPLRTLVLVDESPLVTLGSQAARHALGKQGLAVSWTSVPRQPRLASLPLLVRKTVLELRPKLASSLPVPDRLSEGFEWLRGTLNAAENPAVIIWDGLDLAENLDLAGSWFWLTAPWPSHVRVIVTVTGSPAGAKLRELWARFDVPMVYPSEPAASETPPIAWTKRGEEVAAVLRQAADGRSTAELEAILSPMPPQQIAAALEEFRPYLVSTEEDRWILGRMPGGPNLGSSELALKRTIDYLIPLAKRDRSVESELASLLVRSDDPAHRQMARRHLQSHPLIWQLWSRDRADLFDMVRTWENSSPGAWQHLAESARSNATVEPHHLVAYGDVFEHLGKLEEARETYLASAERASERGGVFHEQAARRRAADCSLRLDDYESALELTPEPASDADLRSYGSACLLRAEAMTELGRTQDAWRVLTDLEKRSFEAGSTWHQIESLSRQASLAQNKDDPTAAANIDAQILILGRTAPVGLPFVKGLAREARRKMDLKDDSTVEVLASELHRAATVVASAEYVGLALGMLASLADRKGEHEGAATMLAAKEKLCRQVGDLEGVAVSMLLRAGVIGLRLGRRAEAVALLESLEKIARTLDARDTLTKAAELGRLLAVDNGAEK
jgi:tetratricopeptide (TPR) repeat protein